MTSVDPDSLDRLFRARGTRTDGADPILLGQLSELCPRIPTEILTLLRLQDGEDAKLTFHERFRFLRAAEILESIRWHRGMATDEELLAPVFCDFVPFLQSGVKTIVGVFASNVLAQQGHVFEYCYETGQLVAWARSAGDFIRGIESREGDYAAFGEEFPAGNMPVIQDSDLYALPDGGVS